MPFAGEDPAVSVMVAFVQLMGTVAVPLYAVRAVPAFSRLNAVPQALAAVQPTLIVATMMLYAVTPPVVLILVAAVQVLKIAAPALRVPLLACVKNPPGVLLSGKPAQVRPVVLTRAFNVWTIKTVSTARFRKAAAKAKLILPLKSLMMIYPFILKQDRD